MREIGGHIYRSGQLSVCISRLYVLFVVCCAIDQCLYARVYVQCCVYVNVVSECNQGGEDAAASHATSSEFTALRGGRHVKT